MKVLGYLIGMATLLLGLANLYYFIFGSHYVSSAAAGILATIVGVGCLVLSYEEL